MLRAMKYKIEVHSQGYEDTCKVVESPSLGVAKREERQAKIEWCEHNDIDLDSNFEMPFTRTTKQP
jgi:hypothetical protein